MIKLIFAFSETMRAAWNTFAIAENYVHKGMYVELGAYKYHVFIDFREVRDNQWNHYAQIANELNGRGVPSIEEAFKEMLLQPLQDALKELANAGMLRRLIERITQPQATQSGVDGRDRKENG